jgi:hypothetical protein
LEEEVGDRCLLLPHFNFPLAISNRRACLRSLGASSFTCRCFGSLPSWLSPLNKPHVERLPLAVESSVSQKGTYSDSTFLWPCSHGTGERRHLPWLHRYLRTRRRLGRQAKDLTFISSLVVHAFRLFKQSPKCHVELEGFKQGSVCTIGSSHHLHTLSCR